MERFPLRRTPEYVYRNIVTEALSIASSLNLIKEGSGFSEISRKGLHEFGSEIDQWIRNPPNVNGGGNYFRSDRRLLQPPGCHFLAHHANRFFTETSSIVLDFSTEETGFDVIYGIGVLMQMAEQPEDFDSMVPDLHEMFIRMAGHASIVGKPGSRYSDPRSNRYMEVIYGGLSGRAGLNA